MYLNFIILDFAQAPADVETLTRRTLASIDPNLSVRHFSPYDAEVAGNFNQDRLLARLTKVEALEIIVVVLIALEIVLAVLRH